MSSAPQFDTMNETDVREVIVRPLLTQLGYQHGAATARVRTEVQLRYAKAFLGRKNESRDPPLAGRADYICEVVSAGRWVVEVKSPANPITRDDVEQAHTYAAHPEIGAFYFLLTNGREFQLYLVGKLDQPLLSFSHNQLPDLEMQLRNVLGPYAIRQKVALHIPDVNKPLGEGLRSTAEVMGGIVRYEENTADHPMFNSGLGNGLRASIVGGRITRDESGVIRALIDTESGTGWMQILNQMSGLSGYEFLTNDEYISTDRERPTLLQNFITSQTRKGTSVNVPGMGAIALPFSMRMNAVTQATGFYHDDRFVGLLEIDYDIFIEGATQLRLPNGMRLPERVRMKSLGDFEVSVRSR